MRLSLLLLIGLILAGCAAPGPMIDFDPSYNFSQDRTFAFISEHPLIKEAGAEVGNPMIEGRLVQITENIMAARGFTRVSNPEEADLAVGFTLGGREKIQVDSYPEFYRGDYGGWGWGGGYYGGYSGQSVDVRQYTEGVLSVDIYDPQERRPVWHGRAIGRITKKMQENPAQVLEQALGNIFATFPPSN